MDRVALDDLFGYTGWVWEQVRATVPDDEILSRAAPGSGWPALRNCLGHIILAYDRWVPAIVELESRPLPELGPDDFRSWSQLDTERRRTRDALERALERWTDAELDELHDVNIDGETVHYSRGELIAHLLLHERGHHGDVTTLFWQLGMGDDTLLEYRFYLGRHQPDY
jgi:uncharacterized damage-inducible protein DinB